MPLRDIGRRYTGKLRRDRRAVVVIEFAYTLPIFMLLGFTGVELANLAVTNMRVSQIAMTVADNISRAKQSVPLQQPVLREVDINDALVGANIQGGTSLAILQQGRIIISSLERNNAGRQTIMWQRCKGSLAVNSQYGAQGATQPSGSGGFQGMGGGATPIQAEPNSAVIFAEVSYRYEPLFGQFVLGTPTIRKEAAFYVRDDRKLGTPTNNVSPAPISRCDQFNATFS